MRFAALLLALLPLACHDHAPSRISLFGGSASALLDIPADGRLASGALISTGTGVTAHLVPGTRVTKLDGDPAAGRYRLELDARAGPGIYTKRPDVLGTVRLRAVEDASGVTTDLQFDPPVEVTLDVEAEEAPGTWSLYGFAAAGGYLRGGDLSAAPAVPETDDLPLGALPLVVDGPETVAMARTDVVGFAYVPDAVSQLAGYDPLPHAVTATVTNLQGARIRSVVLVALHTGEAVAQGYFQDGLGPGDVRRFLFGGHEYEISITEGVPPEWKIEIRSEHANVFTLSGSVEYADGTVLPAAWDAEGGSVDEESTDDEYAGHVLVRIHDVMLSEEATAHLETLRAGLPFWVWTRLLGLVDEDGRRDALIEIRNFPLSVQLLPLPGAWLATRTNRVAEVLEIPADNPIVFGIAEPEVLTRYFTTDGGTPIEQASVRVGSRPRWSPRGNAFAFMTQDVNPPVRIEVVDFPSGQTRLLQGTEDVWGFAWKPDGSALAFISHPESGGSLLQVIDRDGANRQVLLQYDTLLFGGNGPSWSPDGRRIAFVRGSIAAGTQVHVLTLGEPGSVAVTSGSGVRFSPAWAPRGELIAFADGVIGSPGVPTVVDAAMGDMWRISDVALNSQLVELEWSPDAEEVAFTGGTFPDSVIFAARADGSGTRTLVDTPDRESNPAFSPDGLFLVYTRERLVNGSSEYAIFRVGIDGLSERAETPFGALFAIADW